MVITPARAPRRSLPAVGDRARQRAGAGDRARFRRRALRGRRRAEPVESGCILTIRRGPAYATLMTFAEEEPRLTGLRRRGLVLDSPRVLVAADTERPSETRRRVAEKVPVWNYAAVEIGLMVEGQEGVTWPQWRELAAAAERHGFDGLYSSDHYLSETLGSDRDALDAWGTICALAATTARIRLGTVVSPGHLPPSFRARQAHRDRRPRVGRAHRPRHGHRVVRGRAPRLRLPVPLPARAHGHAGGAGGDRPPQLGRRFSLAGDALRDRPASMPAPSRFSSRTPGSSSAAAAARAASRSPRAGRTSTTARRRPRARSATRRARAGGRVRARRPRSRHRALLRHGAASWPASTAHELEQRAVEAARFLGAGRHATQRPAWSACRAPGSSGTPEQIVERLRALSELGVDRALLEPTMHTDLDMLELIGSEVLPALRAPGR